MARLQTLRGMHDLLPNTMRRHRIIVESARKVTECFGFAEMATPIMEFTGVFDRTLGETSDVVTKEMYTFEDRSGEKITMRPENTAGIVRAFIEHGLHQSTPFKVFYSGPMFRYERPQKGRQRQFHQVGVELMGAAQSQADVEVIVSGARTLEAIGLGDQIKLELNTLGDTVSRNAYIDRLIAYFERFKSDLSHDSLLRLEKNPLRILDSKDESDRKVVTDAPVFMDYLNKESRALFDSVCDGLTTLGIPFVHNPLIVRGLDYYCHTAFEFTTDVLGAQGTVLGGGRYDNLISIMGGPPTPGVGWAAGVERLSMMLADVPAVSRPVAIIPLSTDMQNVALKLADSLRSAGLRVDQAYTGSVNKRMKRADKVGAHFAVILGGDEWERGVVAVRNLANGSQTEIAPEAVINFVQEIPE